MALELAEEFENAVERQRLADPPVGPAARDDRGTIDRERDARFAHEHFRLEFALFVGVVEAVVDRLVLKGDSGELPGDVGGPDIMELFHLEKFREFDHVFGPLVVDPVGFPGRILSEIHIGRAVENHVHAFEQRIFRQLCRIDGDDVSFDHLNLGENLIRQFRAAVEFALVTDDFLSSLLCAFYRTLACEADEFAILTLPEQSHNKCTPDETGNAGQKDFLHGPCSFFVKIQIQSIYKWL